MFRSQYCSSGHTPAELPSLDRSLSSYSASYALTQQYLHYQQWWIQGVLLDLDEPLFQCAHAFLFTRASHVPSPKLRATFVLPCSVFHPTSVMFIVRRPWRLGHTHTHLALGINGCDSECGQAMYVSGCKPPCFSSWINS